MLLVPRVIMGSGVNKCVAEQIAMPSRWFFSANGWWWFGWLWWWWGWKRTSVTTIPMICTVYSVQCTRTYKGRQIHTNNVIPAPWPTKTGKYTQTMPDILAFQQWLIHYPLSNMVNNSNSIAIKYLEIVGFYQVYIIYAK